MLGRSVKPPPKVVPKVGGQPHAHPQSHSPVRRTQAHTHTPPPPANDDFEAQVRAEMAKLEADLASQLNIAPPPRKEYPPPEQHHQQHQQHHEQHQHQYQQQQQQEQQHHHYQQQQQQQQQQQEQQRQAPVQSQHAPVQHNSPPKFNPSFEPSFDHNGFDTSSYDPSFDSNKVRAKGGGISNLHGPPDDRLNMKAAKAAAYAKELEDQIAVNSKHKHDHHSEKQYHDGRNGHNANKHKQHSTDGMVFGMAEVDEKAIKRKKQEAYRQQLEAQQVDSHYPSKESMAIDQQGQKYLQKGKHGDDGASALADRYGKPDSHKSGQAANQNSNHGKVFNPSEIIDHPVPQRLQPPQQQQQQQQQVHQQQHQQFSPVDEQYFYQQQQHTKQQYQVPPYQEPPLVQYHQPPSQQYQDPPHQQYHQHPPQQHHYHEPPPPSQYRESPPQQQYHQPSNPQNFDPSNQYHNQYHQQPPQHRQQDFSANETDAPHKSSVASNSRMNMHTESRTPDKKSKRQQQAEYRRQLEVQRQQDELRKKKEKELWKKGNGIRMGTDPVDEQDRPPQNHHQNQNRLGQHDDQYSNPPPRQDPSGQYNQPQEFQRYEQGREHAHDNYDSRNDEKISLPKKGNCTGKVSQLSSEHDKDAKKAKQIEYRRQLELQKQEDIERKKAVKKYWKNESRPNSPNNERGQNLDQNRGHPSSEDGFNQYNNDDTMYNRHQNYEGSISPTKSPTKARNRLVDDVYGGGGFMGNGEADVEKGWMPSKGGGSNEQKKRAIAEQRAALQQQIDETRRRKEEEAKKEKEADELADRRARESYESPGKKKVLDDRTETDRKSKMEAAAREAAVASLRERKQLAQGEQAHVVDTPRDEEYDDFHASPVQTSRSQVPSHSRQSNQASPSRSQKRPQQSPLRTHRSNSIASQGSPSRQDDGDDFDGPSPSGSRRASTHSIRPVHTKESLDLLDDLGLPNGSLMTSDEYFNVAPRGNGQHGRRAATPGGHLESESHILPVHGSSERIRHQSNIAPHRHHHQNKIQDRGYDSNDDFVYRRGVEQEDIFLVDWQHHNGYATKRGITRDKYGPVSGNELEASFVSESKFVPTKGNPWAEGGLLAELTIDMNNKHSSDAMVPRRETVEGGDLNMSVMERSMASESIMTYAGMRTPNISSHGKRSDHSMVKNNSARALDTDNDGQNSAIVPNSPLQHLVQENELQRQSAQKSYQKNRRAISESRDSRDTLERLIGNSYDKVGDNLLLTSRARQSYEDQYNVPHLSEERPLTSAGKKGRISSRDQLHATGHSDVSRSKTASDEVIIVQSPNRPYSGGNSSRRESSNDLLRSVSSSRRGLVNEVTKEEKELMEKEMQDRDFLDLERQGSAHSSRVSSSHSHRSMGRYDISHTGDDDNDDNDDDDDGIDAPMLGRPLSSSTNGHNLSRPSSGIESIKQRSQGSLTSSRNALRDSQSKSDDIKSRPQSKGGNRPQSKSSSRPSSSQSAGSTPYRSEFAISLFQDKPPSSSSTRIYEDDLVAQSKQRSDSSRPQSKHSQVGSRPTSSHSSPSQNRSRPSSKGSENGPARVMPKSKWDTSTKVKEATTEALRKQSSNRIMCDEDDDDEDNDEGDQQHSLEDDSIDKADTLMNLALGSPSVDYNDDEMEEGAFYANQYAENEKYTDYNADEGDFNAKQYTNNDDQSANNENLSEGSFYANQYQNDSGNDKFSRDNADDNAFYANQYGNDGTDVHYNADGFDEHGFDQYGYDQYGYDQYGYDQYGYNQEGYDKEGKLYEDGAQDTELDS